MACYGIQILYHRKLAAVALHSDATLFNCTFLPALTLESGLLALKAVNAIADVRKI